MLKKLTFPSSSFPVEGRGWLHTGYCRKKAKHIVLLITSDAPMTTGITCVFTTRFVQVYFQNCFLNQIIPFRCIDGSISVRGPIFVNDYKHALFFLDNNVTSIVRYFSVISAPLDQGPHEVQSQLVPKFSHAFFLSTHL